jgi:hypothetical protein
MGVAAQQDRSTLLRGTSARQAALGIVSAFSADAHGLKQRSTLSAMETALLQPGAENGLCHLCLDPVSPGSCFCSSCIASASSAAAAARASLASAALLVVPAAGPNLLSCRYRDIASDA